MRKLASLFLLFSSSVLGSEAVPAGKPETTDLRKVENALLERRDDFRRCFDSQKERNSGRVLTRFVVDEQGKAVSASVISSTLRMPKTEECILEIIRGTQFPAPKTKLQITYPFHFKI